MCHCSETDDVAFFFAVDRSRHRIDHHSLNFAVICREREKTSRHSLVKLLLFVKAMLIAEMVSSLAAVAQTPRRRLRHSLVCEVAIRRAVQSRNCSLRCVTLDHASASRSSSPAS